VIELSERYVSDRKTPAIALAATIVHEVTHAWLEHHGFEYAFERRRRLEAICYRAQAAFARRVPGADRLAEHYERTADAVRQGPDSNWSARAARDRMIKYAREQGVPEWVISFATRFGPTPIDEGANREVVD